MDTGGNPGPSVSPFCYVHVPAEDGAAPILHRFEGHDDEELRKRLRLFFSKSKYTDGAKAEMRAMLMSKIQQNQPKVQEVPDADDADAATTAPAAASPQVSQEMLDRLTDEEGAFEIIPVVLPSRQNKFTATSLYIDDKGRFKDLPLNSRASKLAQRDIRGDAFLLSNHDDPALDTWERVDTTMELFEALLTKPPQSTLDTSNQRQMMQAAHARDSDTILVPAEAAAEALELKDRANAMVSKGDFQTASGMYAAATEKLRGRTDLLPNEAALEQARTACFSNLSFCMLKMNQWQAAAAAAAQALRFDPTNSKAWFRMASAQVSMRDFDEADKSISSCRLNGVPGVDCDNLAAASAQGRAAMEAEEKRKFRKMFA